MKTFTEYCDNNNLHNNWSEHAMIILYDCDVLGLNDNWAEAQLMNNRHDEIYKHIINKTKEILERKRFDYINEEQCKFILQNYTRKLYEYCMNIIRNYCLYNGGNN